MFTWADIIRYGYWDNYSVLCLYEEESDDDENDIELGETKKTIWKSQMLKPSPIGDGSG